MLGYVRINRKTVCISSYPKIVWFGVRERLETLEFYRAVCC